MSAAIAAAAPGATAAAPPDLRVVAIQTRGPGAIGDCNAVRISVQNGGGEATREAPRITLTVEGAGGYRQLYAAEMGAALGPGEIQHAWIDPVDFPERGLLRLVAAVDPGRLIDEIEEANNDRTLLRQPRDHCGADTPRSPDLRLDLRLLRAEDRAPIAGAAITLVDSQDGSTLARGSSTADGRASISFALRPGVPVVVARIEAEPCEAARRVVPTNPAPTVPLTVVMRCDGRATDPASTERRRLLRLEIRTPGTLRVGSGRYRLDSMTTRLELPLPTEPLEIELSSPNGTLVSRSTLPAGTEEAVIDLDSEPLRLFRSGIVEDLRSGLLWSAGLADSSWEAARRDCAASGDLDREWRLPSMDDLLDAVDSRQAGDALSRLLSIEGCCLWSTTRHAGRDAMTLYLQPRHFYARHLEDRGIGALCVSGIAAPSGHDSRPVFAPQ